MKVHINLLIIFSVTLTKVFADADYESETDIINRNSSRPGKICEFFNIVFPPKYSTTCLN